MKGAGHPAPFAFVRPAWALFADLYTCNGHGESVCSASPAPCKLPIRYICVTVQLLTERRTL